MDFSVWVEVFDPNDIYDLSYVSREAEYVKIIELDHKKYSSVQRVFDALNSVCFIGCSNENVKSALFSIPDLLYDSEGNFLEEECILELLKNVLSRIDWEIDVLLNEEDYWKVHKICRQIYFEKNEQRYLRKGSSFTLKKVKVD